MDAIQSKPVRSSEVMTLTELTRTLWQGKWIISGFTFLMVLMTAVYSLSLPNVYRSEATLSLNNPDQGFQLPGGLGGLGELAGLKLGGGSNKGVLTIEILDSRDFLAKFINEHDLYVSLIAAKGWDRASNKLILDPKLYDEQQETWVRKVSEPYQPKPSSLEAVSEFKRLMTVNHNKTNDVVKIAVSHYSPYIAYEWTNALVKAINKEMRAREKIQAEKSMEYLKNQIALTNIADVRVSVYELIEEQMKRLMLVNVRDEFVLETIDPAIVPEKKSGPARALLCLLAAMFGVIASSLFVIIKRFINSSRNEE